MGYYGHDWKWVISLQFMAILRGIMMIGQWMEWVQITPFPTRISTRKTYFLHSHRSTTKKVMSPTQLANMSVQSLLPTASTWLPKPTCLKLGDPQFQWAIIIMLFQSLQPTPSTPPFSGKPSTASRCRRNNPPPFPNLHVALIPSNSWASQASNISQWMGLVGKMDGWQVEIMDFPANVVANPANVRFNSGILCSRRNMFGQKGRKELAFVAGKSFKMF